MKREERIRGFVEVLWQWFDVHKRDLPWRDIAIEDDTQRAYQILVSEIMLQQTQVSRVKVTYRNFLERFPTLEGLAAADNAAVILAWRGMGYNSRALRLRDAARTILQEQNGTFPREMQDLLAVKGIGHYTAAAVRNFAFNLPTACLDTNIRRILHRVFVGPECADGTWPKDDAYLLTLAKQVLCQALSHDGRKTADWHAALMDYGSLVCTRRSPKWDQCPLAAQSLCKAAYRVPELNRTARKEPGRRMGGRFVPDRIFRGRVVEELRDAPQGLPLEEIGRRVCLDWEEAHQEWLQKLLKKLVADQLIVRQQAQYQLAR